ncbi:MAG: phenylalanine 4-monooxygenase [Proteobacteria bacterium]|nr:phenylalanine 4-monooxygenase [Pseudomonadota bacterium]
MEDDKGHAILTAQTVEECIIDQNWGAYSAADHNTWKTLYNRQLETLKARVCEEYLEGLKTLHLVAETVPDFAQMNKHLRAATGWEVLAVPGLIASKPFFSMLANRQFPAGTFIRTPEQLDYLEEPDIFHDVFGHIPLLSNPAYANYMQEYGRAGLAALEHKGIKFLARLNWYTIEFGLIKNNGEVKAYGAGIMSSYGEAKYLFNDPSANWLQFDIDRVLRTGYYIDDLQASYFTIDSFESLFKQCIERPFIPLYEKFRAMPALTPFEIVEGDTVLRKGTGEYWREFPVTKPKLK